jgi:hypothetical protein
MPQKSKISESAVVDCFGAEKEFGIRDYLREFPHESIKDWHI